MMGKWLCDLMLDGYRRRCRVGATPTARSAKPLARREAAGGGEQSQPGDRREPRVVVRPEIDDGALARRTLDRT
jgi:hypothetical protein